MLLTLYWYPRDQVSTYLYVIASDFITQQTRKLSYLLQLAWLEVDTALNDKNRTLFTAPGKWTFSYCLPSIACSHAYVEPATPHGTIPAVSFASAINCKSQSSQASVTRKVPRVLCRYPISLLECMISFGNYSPCPSRAFSQNIRVLRGLVGSFVKLISKASVPLPTEFLPELSVLLILPFQRRS